MKFIKLSLAICLILLPLGACTKEDTDKLVSANHKVANAIDKSEQFTWELYGRGLLDKESYLGLNQVLSDVNGLAGAFHAKARTYETFDAVNKADLLKFAEDSRDVLRGKIDDGTLRIKDPEARRQWKAVADNIFLSFSSVVEIVRAIKPTPPPDGK